MTNQLCQTDTESCVGQWTEQDEVDPWFIPDKNIYTGYIVLFNWAEFRRKSFGLYFKRLVVVQITIIQTQGHFTTADPTFQFSLERSRCYTL